MVAVGASLSFSPETKCCTFTPGLANFLIGAILEAGGDGARTVRDRVSRGEGVSPLGLGAGTDPAGPDTFGRDLARKCPHLTSGGCSIWFAREATCSTWFCKHDRGALGKSLWNRVEQLLHAADRALALRVAIDLGIPAPGLAMDLPLVERGRARHDWILQRGLDAAAVWGPWEERIEPFFRAALARAKLTSFDDLMAAGGSELAALREVAVALLVAHGDRTLPPRIRLGHLRVVEVLEDAVRVQSYSMFDPLLIPKKLFEVLRFFDGRPTAEAIERAGEAAGEPVPPGALRMLVDHEILHPATD